MQAALALSLFLAILFLSYGAAAQESVTPSDRVTAFVNIREQPSSHSARLGQLQKNESLPYEGSVPRWHKVRLNAATIGHVSKAWTKVVPTMPPGSNSLVIHYLSVGAGTCTLIECPGNDAPPMFIDCGFTSGGGSSTALSPDEVKTKVESILAGHSVAPNVVITHGHTDHYNLFPTVLGGETVQNIWIGGKFTDYSSAGISAWIDNKTSGGATLHKDFPAAWHNQNLPIEDGLSCGEASTYVLNVNSGSGASANSLMLMIEYGDFTAIFPGDATGGTEDSALANFGSTLKTTVLAGTHHGASSKHSNDRDWAEATAPDVVIYSSGTEYGHPRCEASNRYHPHLKTVPGHPMHCNTSSDYSQRRMSNSTLGEYVTDANGTITVTSNGSSPLHLTCESGPGCDVQIPY